MDSFVYCWTDHRQQKLYVGMHKGHVNDGYICSSKHMRKEYDVRPADFTRQIIAIGSYEVCREFEIKLIKAMFDQKVHCYNLNYGGVILHTPEIKAKISATHKNKVISDAHKEAIRQWNRTKRQPTSKETKEKIRKQKLGIPRKPLTDEWKANIGKALLGKKRSAEFGAAVTARQLGTKRGSYPEEAKEKQRLAHLGKKHSPETLAKLKAIKSNVSEETKAKISAAKKAYWERRRSQKNA